MNKLQEIKRNFHLLRNGDTEEYYSYETMIAFRHNGILYIRENVWGCTTGKHLNYINRDHKIRISEEEFKKKYEECKRPKLNCSSIEKFILYNIRKRNNK